MTPERLELLQRVVDRHGCELHPLYYVTSDDAEDLQEDFCREHALVVRFWHERETGHDTRIARQWSETDSAHAYCAFGGCGKLLRTDGGITSYGVNSALALTETDPFECSVSPEELELAACAMVADDPRWETWDKQAKRLLRMKPWRKPS